MSAARALFESFHGRAPTAREIAFLKQNAPEETLEVGKLHGVMYKVNGIKEPYFHKFGPNRRPDLFVSANGKQIYILNGAYRFTDRGFIG